MAGRPHRSKKQSASSAKPPEGGAPGEVVFFVDRSLGKKAVPGALRDAGAMVEIHDDYFPEDAPDTEWLAFVGAKGWVVLSKDEAIRRRAHETDALREANVRAFILTSAKLTGVQMAELFGKMVPRMERTSQSVRAPFVFLLSSDGRLRRFL